MVKVSVKTKGRDSEKAFKKMLDLPIEQIFNEYGKRGVDILSNATPVDSGKTAASWGYEVKKIKGKYSLTFLNYNINDGYNVALLIQYGHGTGTGGYVRGIDYIDSNVKDLFNAMLDEMWEKIRAC